VLFRSFIFRDFQNIKLCLVKGAILAPFIFNEFIETQTLVTKNIENFRFDEASRILYQFVWHTYCDWYLEFLKPIFNSKNATNIKEAKLFSSFMMANILKMLHPFIPFFTEKVCLDLKLNKKLKTPLMQKEWYLQFKPNNEFKLSYEKIDWITKLVTSIRSTKVDLDVSPGDFIDVSIHELDKKKKNIIVDNITVFKRLGRVRNINQKKLDRQGINIIVGVETVTLYFSDSINLSNQKLKLSKKFKELENKVNNLSNKLKNKSFLENAPKTIVLRDKKSLINYNVELKKLNSILNSINN
jgi:valyl-tRNA synthetase